MELKRILLAMVGIALIASALVGVFLWLGGGEERQVKPRFKTPKDTVRTLIKAYNSRDIGAYKNCFSAGIRSETSENTLKHLLDVAENWNWKLRRIEEWKVIVNTVNTKAWGVVGVRASGVNQLENAPVYENGRERWIGKGESFTRLLAHYTRFVNEGDAKENEWKISSSPGLFQPIYYSILQNRNTVVKKVRKRPGTLTPGIHLEGKKATVEIISVKLMTGKDWKKQIKSYEGIGGQIHKPGDNEKLWVVNYTCQARSAGIKLGEYHRVMLWKAFDARTGSFEYFHGESLEEAKSEPLTLGFEISFISEHRHLATENLGKLKGKLTLKSIGEGRYQRRLEMVWSDEKPDKYYDISFKRYCGTSFYPRYAIIPAPPLAYKPLVDFLRNIYAASGLSIRPREELSRKRMLKEIIRSFGEDPEEILTKKFLGGSKPHRTVIGDDSQVDMLRGILKDTVLKELDGLRGDPE